MTNGKMNLRGMHAKFQCKICCKENESQQHKVECRKLNKIIHENIDYAKIENLNLNQMVAKKFKKNIGIRDMGEK